MNRNTKLILVLLITTATLTFHYYDLIFMGLFGHSHLMHAIHGRLCYIPIVLAAFWFGLRGGLLTAFTISLFSMLYIFIRPISDASDLYGEYAEIAFYFAIGGFAGILLDSERSSRNKKEEAERKLLQAERLSVMGQMVASIAHEIKNPLGSIKGAVQILGDKSTPQNDRQEFTSIIEKEVDRLDKVVKEYLTFAKPTPGKSEKIDLNEILQAVIKQMKFQGGDHNVQIEFAPELVPAIKGDSDKFRDLFINIILNSLQAMPSGGKIEITCRKATEDSSPMVETRITDNGPGIAPENLNRIFEPFFSTKAQGTGLGLATARSIVGDYNGTIKAESVLGKGTTFIISFPVFDRKQI
jgi:two-component system, NtrC family, sensor histidine kinase HydH